MLDNIDVIVRHVRDESQGVQIPGTDDADSQRGAGPTSGSGKGKEKVVTPGCTRKAGSRSLPRDTGTLTESSASSEKKRALVHSD
jgi:hypothetical protein